MARWHPLAYPTPRLRCAWHGADAQTKCLQKTARMSLSGRLRQREAGALSAPAFAWRCAVGLRASLRLSGRLFARCATPGCGLLCLQLEPREERFLLVGAADGSVAVYDSGAVSAGGGGPPVQPTLRLPRGDAAHAYACTSVAWYPDAGGLFFSCGLDHLAKGYDLHCGGAEVLRFRVGGGQRASLMALALPSHESAPHGLLAGGSSDGRVLLLDPGSGGSAHALTGHRGAVLALAWLPGHDVMLASGCAGGALRLWAVRTTAGCLHVFDQHASSGAQPSAGEARFATAHCGAVTALSWSPCAHFLFSSAADGRLRRWCARTGRDTLTHYATGAGDGPLDGLAAGQSLPSRIAITSDGRRLYRPEAAGAVQAFCTRTGACLARLRGGHHSGPVRSLVVRSHSEELFTAGSDGALLGWTAGRSEGEDGDEAQGARDEDAWSDDEEETHRGPRMAYRAHSGAAARR